MRPYSPAGPISRQRRMTYRRPGSVDRLLSGPTVSLGELPARRHVLLPPEDIDRMFRGVEIEDRVFQCGFHAFFGLSGLRPLP